MLKLVKWAALMAVGLAMAALAAGRLGFFAGTAPANLGVTNGRLLAPSVTPNSVSSQAAWYPEHPQHAYAAMEPIPFSGDPGAAMDRIAGILERQQRTVITTRGPGYLRAESTTRWLGFTDDLEFVVDPQAGVIHFRSASRLGRKDFGTNRARMETIRAQFLA